ncbi:MAG: stage 0 sporulation protein [Candidatus Thermofonsia Clade 1 bacterium]|uniref:Stage 0 sporulation protein n=1 Tax=Candidatus Thermofonsia Clade 1 bacterium TaxID=2364210 RepID=A0A2M8PH91_9CHLR|nr:MAG: stage 0 sporulation protein [Candidatus Thermofonsia Clade 1 bacterium]
MTEQTVATPTRIAGVRFQRVGKLYHFDCSNLPDVAIGDHVIVETVRGEQMGQIAAFYRPEEGRTDYKPILRLATPRDLLLKQAWEEKQLPALIECREIATQLGGYERCKFLAAQYSYDGSLLTVLYSTEDNHLNMNRLKNALSAHFPSRVELRQVGPRDVAKLIGGMGACGIPRCCSTFLTEFSPISIKMAKVQGISLNPTEITGMCGRLRCCLIYEYEQYVEARQGLPKRNKRVRTPHGEGKVVDVHPLQDAVTVLIGEIRHVVKREDLVPLDELEALERKAQGGCARHASGGCDCGARRAAPDRADLSEEDDDLEDAQSWE